MNDYQVNWQEIASVVVNGKDITTDFTDILKIPANTVLTGLVYEEVEKADEGIAITLKAKVATQQFSGFTTGTGTTKAVGYKGIVEASATASGGGSAIVVPQPWFTKDSDTLTIKGGSALTKGKLRIGLVGFKTGMTANRTEETNQAVVDPYIPPEKR